MKAKILYLQIEHILTLLVGLSKNEIIPVPILDLPPDTKVERWFHSWERDSWGIVLSNPAWEDVPPSHIPPTLQIQTSAFQSILICQHCKLNIDPRVIHTCPGSKLGQQVNLALGRLMARHSHSGGFIPGGGDVVATMLSEGDEG